MYIYNIYIYIWVNYTVAILAQAWPAMAPKQLRKLHRASQKAKAKEKGQEEKGRKILRNGILTIASQKPKKKAEKPVEDEDWEMLSTKEKEEIMKTEEAKATETAEEEKPKEEDLVVEPAEMDTPSKKSKSKKKPVSKEVEIALKREKNSLL